MVFFMRPWISWRLRLTRALRISNTEVPEQKRQFPRCGCFRLHPGPMGGSPVWLSLAPQLNWLRHVMRRRQFLTPFQVHRDLRQLQEKRAAKWKPKLNGTWMPHFFLNMLLYLHFCLAGQIQGREGRRSWSVFFEGIIYFIVFTIAWKDFFLGPGLTLCLYCRNHSILSLLDRYLSQFWRWLRWQVFCYCAKGISRSSSLVIAFTSDCPSCFVACFSLMSASPAWLNGSSCVRHGWKFPKHVASW